jgi:cytochrome c
MSISRWPRGGSHFSLVSLVVPIAAFCAVAVVRCSSRPSDEWSSQSGSTARTFPEQVDVGQALFAKHCADCHGKAGEGGKAPRLVGLKDGALPVEPPADRKFRKTRFVNVADVADFVIHSMPPKKVGILSDDEYWALIAFDLHANGVDLPQRLTPEVATRTTIPR